MPKLRQLALYCADSQLTATFYEQAFGMKAPGATTSHNDNEVHLTDGVMDLVLLPYRASGQSSGKICSASGIGHIGFVFDQSEAQEIGMKLKQLGTPRAGTATDAEMIGGHWKGPDGVLIHLMDRKTAEKHYSAVTAHERRPKLNHVALFTLTLQQTTEFYQLVFGMEEVGRREAPLSDVIFLTDGYINFSVVCFKSQEIAVQKHYPPDFGVNHFGFLVEDQEAAAVRLRASGAERVETIPNIADKWKGPDGTVFDVTDKT